MTTLVETYLEEKLAAIRMQCCIKTETIDPKMKEDSRRGRAAQRQVPKGNSTEGMRR